MRRVGSLWSVLLAVATFWNVCSLRVPLNPYCSLYDDVDQMDHDTVRRTVQVLYKPGRRCREPSLIVRLSGTALLILKNEGWKNNTQEFSYPPLIDDGKYFLEAVVIFCVRYDSEAIGRQCVENAHYGRNVLTLPYSFHATRSVQDAPAATRPRWVHRNTTMPKLLPTRHLMLISESPGVSKCSRHVHIQYCAFALHELHPYYAYTWTDAPKWLDDAKTVFERLTAPADFSSMAMHTVGSPSAWVSSTPLINICFVGDSHSRILDLRRVNETDGMATFTYIFSLFPPLFNITTLAEYRCSVAVLSYGLWSLSDVHTNALHAHTQTEHKAQMGALIKQLAAYQGPTRIYIRSENINGLGFGPLSCSSNDRRSPPAFDMVNRVTKELCDHYKIPFIDLDPVIYPMWDGAWDYCHPSKHVLDAEVSYILHRVFKHTLANKQVLTTHHVPQQVVNDSYAYGQAAEVAAMKLWLTKTHGTK